jgi:hypothetical protein
MDETIQDTFLNFKVDGNTTKLVLLEDSLTTRIMEVDEALKHIATNILQPSDMLSGVTMTQGTAPNTTEDDLKPAALRGMEVTDDASLPQSCFPPFNVYWSGLSFPSGYWYPHPQETWFPPCSCTQQESVDVAYDMDRECHKYDTHQNFGHPHSLPYHRTSGLQNVSTDDPHGDRRSQTDHHVDRAMDDDDRTYVLMGGPIKSHSNVECHQQARQHGISRFDMAALAEKDYSGGVRGFDPLSIRIIKNSVYTAITSDDIILCYQDIMLLHQKLWRVRQISAQIRVDLLWSG